MKTHIYLLSILIIAGSSLRAQQNIKADTSGFNYSYWNALADKKHYNPNERAEFIEGCKKMVLREQQQGHQHLNGEELVWITEPSSKGYNPSYINAGPCTNIDFEAGNMSSWVRSNGYNPLFNPAGCCGITNGDQTIMTGTGTDPFGGFPVVYPGGGSFSLRLGSPTTGGRADRIEQTFFVTPSNANFTYRYAVVLNDGGHPIAQQPRFTIEMIDTLGNGIPCTFYNVSAGSNIAGYFTSSLTANGNSVIYKPWTNVVIDLTPNIGQNVTLRFTVYDCSPSGHFAYAYIDGLCTNFQTSVADTTCPNIPFTMCGPVGFGSYRWDGPGVVNNPNQCISVSAPGIYTCQTILVPGCPGPVFTHTLSTWPNPVLTFTPSTGICSPQYSFVSTSSISAGSITSYTYSFGDNTGTFLQSPVHTYPGPGAYNVKFKAYTDRGCRDSIQQTIFVHPNPLLSFSPPSHCINTLVQFTNTSVMPAVTGVPLGSIVSYTWNLGNGQTSNLPNPSTTYTSSGTFTVTLSATSNMGCVSTLQQTLGIFPPPVLSFTANPLCDINGTAFMPSATGTISSGNIVSYFWNFGDGGTSTLQNPVHIYAAAGVYTITYTGTSNHSCVQSVSQTLTISPTPAVSFNTFSLNACNPSFTFANTSTVTSPGTISYNWNFGGTNTTNVASPQYTFPAIGSYTIRLIGTSNMGCSDTAYHFVTLYPLPVVSVSVPASCENAIFTVSTAAVSGSITSYSWNFGDPASGTANTSTLQNPTHAYNNVGNYVISLLIISNQNCPSTYTSPIFVRPNPVSTLTFFPSDACTPTYSFINNSGFNPSPPPTGNNIAAYLWNFSGLGTSTVTSPVFSFPGPGNYTVSLVSITNHNCRDTVSSSITIHPYPSTTINVSNSCLNVAAQYNGTFSIAQAPLPGSVNSFTWNFGDGAFDNSNLSTTHNYVSPGPYTVALSVTSNQGCVTTRTSNLVIHPLPVINFNFANTCAGAPVTFSNSTTIQPGGSVVGYAWDFEDDGVSNSVLPSPIFTYSAAGIYQVELVAKTNFNCVDSVKKSITIYDVPVPVISTSNVCASAATPYSASLSLPGSGGQITAYNWNFGDGSNAGTTSSGVHQYASPGVYTLQLVATNNFNCSRSSTSLVTVHHVPTTNFIANETCLNSPTSFTNLSNITSPDQISSWRWDFGTGWIKSLAADTSYVFSAPGTFVVQLEAMSNNQCIAVKSLSVVVHSNPIANFGTAVVCVGDNINFTNLSTSSDGTIVSNAWDYNGDNVVDLDAQVPKYTYSGQGLFAASLTVTTIHGCKNSKTRNVYANPKAVPSFTSDIRGGCPELCVNFKNLSSISSGTFTSKWDFNDGSSTSIAHNPKHCFGEGSFSVSLELKSDSGCKSVLNIPDYMTVSPNPVAGFVIEPDELDEDDPTITVKSTASRDATTQRYYITDGATYGSPNFTHYIKNLEKKTKPMIVQIVKNDFGCVDTLYKVMDIKPAFVIYVPNVFTPNGDNRNDGFQAKGVGIIKFAMQIYDRWGHLVWSTNDITDSWDGNVKGGFDSIKQDVFTWKAQVVDVLNKSHNLVGHVTLIK